MARIVCLGEGMLELSRTGEGNEWRMGFGGDTLNTAIHLARAGHDVAFMTALGRDPFSGDLRNRWENEGLDCSLVATHPTRQPGLYAITTDARGERSFTYWREASAARALFELEEVERLLREAEWANLLYFSLISLAILPDAGRQRVLDLAQCVGANGGLVAFDGNYRAPLWESEQVARNWRDVAIAVADIGLPTLDDEVAMGSADDAEAVAAHWQGLGCGEVIVKLGAGGCRMADGSVCPVPEALHPVDTSGAGDAFNAGYLAARMRGLPDAQAALAGHVLAGWCVMRRGAIPVRDSAAPY